MVLFNTNALLNQKQCVNLEFESHRRKHQHFKVKKLGICLFLDKKKTLPSINDKVLKFTQ